MATKEPEKLSAQQRSKIRRLSEPRELAPDEEGGELNIVPFLDIIMNVLMFVLATVSVTFTATIDTFPPAKRGRLGARPPTTPTLGLTVLIVRRRVQPQGARRQRRSRLQRDGLRARRPEGERGLRLRGVESAARTS